MVYKLISPPISLDFNSQKKEDLLTYKQWYLNAMPERILELSLYVNESKGFANWKPDFHPTSLLELGKWFESKVALRFRTMSEIELEKSKLVFDMPISNETLSEKTVSLCFDVSMYFSEVILKNCYGLSWGQDLKNRRNMHYGQPVILKFVYGELNPFHLLVTLSYGFIEKNKTYDRLYELYEIWSKSAISGEN